MKDWSGTQITDIKLSVYRLRGPESELEVLVNREERASEDEEEE